MLTLPDAIVALLVPFATLFTSPTWRKAQLLLIGAILTPGQRTVAAALRVMGRSDQRDYARYHEVLNRAVWSSRQAARILLVLLLQHLDGGDGPLIFGIDETLERRRGAQIRARAIYRDPVRSRWSRPAACAMDHVPSLGAGHLPRPGAFQPVSGGQGQRPALDLPDVAGPPKLPAGLPDGGAARALLSVPGPCSTRGGLTGAGGVRIRPVTTNSRDASTRSSPTGPSCQLGASWSCN